MVDNVGLGSSINSALQSGQRTSQQSNQTNERLGTGQQIDDSIDGAEDFFTAQALTNRATNLAQVKDQVSQAIGTIQAADIGLEAINDLSGQARAISQQAQNTSDPTERARLAVQFNQIRVQIDSIASDSGIDGKNLISSSPDTLEVSLNEGGSSLLAAQGVDSTSSGLGISSRTFGSDADIDAAIADISIAQTQVRTTSNSLSSSTSALQNRIDFTDSLSNTLEQGAARLTQADLNEQAASLLSLQTRQALGANSLTIATDNERAVLDLFG
jgi:flagellin